MDFYECIFIINSEDKIDLTVGIRNIDLEKKCNCTKDYLDLAIGKLKILDFDVTDTVSIVDDFGLGDIEIPNTYGSLLAQANSHTIRHYAIINYIFDSLGIVINDSEYGYSPTTPKADISKLITLLFLFKHTTHNEFNAFKY